jgi:glutathione S-transferase
MKLYANRHCPFSRRVRIALVEKQIPYEYVEMSPTAEHPKELLGKTPSSSGTPILYVRDDLVLFDSTAMVRWLDGAYPHSLTPGALEHIAIADCWAGWAPARLYPSLYALTDGDDAAKKRAKRDLVEALRGAEALIPESGWLVASMFSRADIAMAPALAILPRAVMSQLPPRVRAYADRLRARPSVREVCEVQALESRPSWAA